MKIIQVTDLPLELGFVLPVALDFLQASTLTHVCAKSNLWTSAGSTGCPSCTTCAPQSAPLPAALTHRAMRRSLRTRAACPLTVCREFFWDSPAWKSLWPSLALSVCNCVQHIYKLLSYFYTHTQFYRQWLYATHKMWDCGPFSYGPENMYLERDPFPCSPHIIPQNRSTGTFIFPT